MNLKTLRNKKGLTQKDVAQFVGCNTQQISNIERGTSRIPIKRVYEFSKIYGVSVDRILKSHIAEWEFKKLKKHV